MSDDFKHSPKKPVARPKTLSAPLKTIPCRFFLKGDCAAGNACPFSHDRKLPQQVCPFFLHGNCKFGDQCALSHSVKPKKEPIVQHVIVKQPKTVTVPFSTEELRLLPSDLQDIVPSTFSRELSVDPLYDIQADDSIDYSRISKLYPGDHTLVVPSNKADIPLCEFAINGNCNRENCRNIHGSLCSSCMTFCLHPFRPEEAQAHIRSCSQRTYRAPKDTNNDLECCICLENVEKKMDSRFGLLNCEHVFCLGCIRSWRAEQTIAEQLSRSCPVCRILTHFVTPSPRYLRNGAEKERVIETYKLRLRKIPCKHFGVDMECPFGQSCFYAHILPDGTEHSGKQRTCVDSDSIVRQIVGMSLKDFLPQ